MAEVDDNIREIEWRDLVDTMLVFVCIDTPHDILALMWFRDGLFAAFLSAFLLFQLQPNSTDVTMDMLIHISQQLNNSTTPAFVPTPFQVSSNAPAVNMLFFLSLTLFLIDAFLAMLVKGWLHEFDRGWRKYTVAHLRAQERERRLQEIERWKLHELVSLLPTLIQGSLLLLCIGLLLLIFPLHLPSAIFCSFAFIIVVGFNGFITYISTVNDYAPFSSLVSRLLAHGLEIVQTYTWCTTSAIRFYNHSLLHLQEQQSDAETMWPLPSKNKHIQPHKPDSNEKSKVTPRSHFDIDPQTHVHVLKWLVSTTAETVENIPNFLELLEQPVKSSTIRPSNVEKWRELFGITFRLLKNQSSLPVSTAWTLARTMMLCYNRDAADFQLCLTLQHHLGSWETDDQRPHMPLNALFSFYFGCWIDDYRREGYWNDQWRAIAFLEPSEAADVELLWMVLAGMVIATWWPCGMTYLGHTFPYMVIRGTEHMVSYCFVWHTIVFLFV